MANILRPPAVLGKIKESYSLWFRAMADFPRPHRFGLGGEIEKRFLKTMETVSRAIYQLRLEKSRLLAEAIIELDSLKFFLAVAWENKCLSSQRYGDLSERLDEVGRMLGGWKKGLENKTPVDQTGETQ